MAVTYEWDIELVEVEDGPEEPDIIDHEHRATLAEFDPADLKAALAQEIVADHRIGYPVRARLVLVRDVGNDTEGLTDRTWAHVTDDKQLPELFTYGNGEDGMRVPQRFRDELAKVR